MTTITPDPLENSHTASILVGAPQAAGPYNYNACSYLADKSALNNATAYNVTGNPGFIDSNWTPDAVQDFGLLPSSRIYSIDPKFKSCPRSEVGPTDVTQGAILSLYGRFWNVPEPENYGIVIAFDLQALKNASLEVPLSELNTTDVSLTPW